jgi:hypothetical protein
MKITNQQAYAIYQQQQDIKQIDRRHEALQIEDRHIHDQLRLTELKRIEHNRVMGLNGQNIDQDM